MKSENGVATDFAPLQGDVDAEILRLENIARTGLQPRILNLQTWPVALKQGGSVVVVRTPRSYNPPHRVIRQGKGQNRFWVRSSAGKYEPDVDELRFLFLVAPEIGERARRFRADRLNKIKGGTGPVPLQEYRFFVLHIMPFSAFGFGS